MTDTVLSSASKEVAIGFGRPFVMIGERINPTGRNLLAEEMKNGDFSRVESDAIAQVKAGAQMLDVNAGIPLADEPALLAQAIRLVQSVTDVPLAIDSSIIEALEAGLAAYEGKPLVNSVTGEEEVMERVLPLVARHGAAVVAISNDDTGISEDPDVLRRLQRQLRPPQPAPRDRHLPCHGHRRRHDLGDHEPPPRGGEDGHPGRRRAGRPRHRLRRLDPRTPRPDRRCRPRAPWPSPPGLTRPPAVPRPVTR